MTKLMSTVVTLLFVFSLVPFVSTTDHTAQLRDAITMVRLLQHPEKQPDTSFKTIFSRTIISLQTAAGLASIFTHQQSETDAEAKLSVSVQLPFLPAPALDVEVPIAETADIPSQPSPNYRSHITAPPSPPPLCS
ncbi:hypothetical protein [Desulfofustis limnaeus]|nr:hypothetical protein [Desulfofustis limnaeus]